MEASTCTCASPIPSTRISIARPLAITTMGLFGARSYFRRHRRPRALSDLAHHRFALYNEPPVLDEWTFERRGKRTKIRLRPAIVANSGEMVAAAVSSGVAMRVLPSFLLSPEHGDLIEPVMLEWSLGQRGIYAVYPHRRFVPSKVRAFVDFSRAALGGGGQRSLVASFDSGSAARARTVSWAIQRYEAKARLRVAITSLTSITETNVHATMSPNARRRGEQPRDGLALRHLRQQVLDLRELA